MSWLTRLTGLILGAEPRPRDPADDWWYGPIQAQGQAILPVGPDDALQIPAVVDALVAISHPIAHLPFKVFRRIGTDRSEREPAPDHPAASLLDRPGGLTRFEWRGQMQWELALHANALAEWEWGPAGPVGLRWHAWRHVRVETRAGRPVYHVHDGRTASIRSLSADDVLHLRSLPLDSDGVCGRSPLVTNQEVLAHALAVHRYGARYFANDAQSGGVIEPSHPFKTHADETRWLAAWRRARTGRNAHRDALLMPGMKYQRHTGNNEQAQFIETRREAAIEVARIWHVPPHKLRSLDRATHSNIEQQALEFVSDCLLPWFALWETAIKRHVIDPLSEGAGLTDDYFVEFNAAGLLRGDLLSRYRAYAIGRQWGWLSVNDILRLENRPPIGADGDVYLQPMNMQPAGEPLGDGAPQNPPGPPPR